MPPDVRIRGCPAMIAAYGTVGIPTLAVLGVFSGAIQVADLEPLL